MTHDEFMEIVRKSNSSREIREDMSEAEKLKRRILYGDKTDEECLELQKEVIAFFESDAPEEDKKMLLGYTESLSMLCSAIKQGLI